ncbi:MAG: RtcB family protein [Coriobacteriales bacterium]|nr:RtcB family protein [Coriobacteriales bacterium]
MFLIKGAYSTAACYATNIEPEAVEQIRAMCDQPFTEGERVAIMPDAHAGKGCTIGTTMTVTNKAVPNVVGVDIGCGMYTVDIGCASIDLPGLDEACHAIPSGFRVWDGRKERFDLTELRCYRALSDTKRLERSLGTLGGGNHFVEVDVASDGTQYLVIHSGSRNLGTQVANHYQKLAVELHQGKEEYFTRRDTLIAEYKAAGRRKEIQTALKQLHWKEQELDAPQELCWLYGTYFEDYLHDVAICQAFARRNRELMAEVICSLAHLHDRDAFHTVHNYIDTDEKILRKGAIAAHANELVLIPLNMRDGSVLARGKGNPAWNYSAPHGAGRILSRKAAKEQLSLDEYRSQMAGVFTTSVSAATLDEAPGAYKSAEDILGPIAEAVDILEVLRPIYNFKAS